MLLVFNFRCFLDRNNWEIAFNDQEQRGQNFVIKAGHCCTKLQIRDFRFFFLFFFCFYYTCVFNTDGNICMCHITTRKEHKYLPRRGIISTTSRCFIYSYVDISITGKNKTIEMLIVTQHKTFPRIYEFQMGSRIRSKVAKSKLPLPPLALL